MENARIADRLDAFALLLELHEANPYTVRAYRRAAATIRGAAVPVAEMGEQAWQRMWDLLSGRPPGPTLVLSPHVVRRGSAGPAPDPGEQLNRGTANGP